jgi:NAD(P)H-dependent FMN reductase/predicted ester cyclase
MSITRTELDILVLVGTAREGRNTNKPANAVNQVFKEQGHQTNFYDLKEKDIPPVGNRTYADEDPVPEDIKEFKRCVKDSDCIVIVNPEYTHSIPGVLKTTIDYLYPEYDDKPFAFVPVSAGGFGGVRGLQHLHDIVLEIGGRIGPSLPVSKVGDKFDEKGNIQDEEFKQKLEEFHSSIEEFINKQNCVDREKLVKVRKLYRDIWSGENLDSADNLIHPEYSIEHADFQDDKKGPDKIKELARDMFEAFPDMETEIEEIIPNQERIAVRWTMRGTHKGSRYGEAPTGKEVEMKGMEFLKFEEGKIKEHNAVSDTLGLKKQIGALDE